jgi:outer membrane protein TolC
MLLAALGSAAMPSRAADAPAAVTTSLTLEALVAETLERNPELKFYEAENAAAKAGRRTAGLFANPELGGSVGQKTVRGGGSSDEGVA